MTSIVIPSRGLIFTETIRSVLLEADKHECRFYFTKGLPIPDCFNQPIDQALKDGAKYIFLVEEDQVIPEGTLQALYDADSDVALYDYPNKRTGKPFASVVNGEFQYAGIGCCLIKAEVLKELGYPYFKKALYNLGDDKKPKFVMFRESGDGYGGHDVHFYQTVIKMGKKVTLLTDKKVGHCMVEKMGPDCNDFGQHKISTVFFP